MPIFQDDFPSALAHLPFVFEQEVVWGEMDALNHVNNVSYMRYAESSRFAFIFSAGLSDISPNPTANNGELVLLAEVNIRYKAPVVYPDTLLIGVGVSAIEDTSYTLLQHFYSTAQKCITTECTARLVNFDTKAGRRAKFETNVLELLNQNLIS